MLKQEWPSLAGLGLGLAGAAGAAAYIASGGSETGFAFAGAMGSAILAIFSASALIIRQTRQLEAGQRRIMRDVAGFHGEIRRKSESLQSKLEKLQQQTDGQSEVYARGFAELKESYQSLQQTMQAQSVLYAAPRPAPARPALQKPEPVFTPPQPKAEENESFADRLLFALEPIVDVQTGKTVHYRMHVSIQIANEELASDKLLHYAGRVSKRAELDIVSLRESYALLEKLRQRDPELSIFVNIGAETLANSAAVAQILDNRNAAMDLSAGIVFEMPHAMLAGLSEPGLEGLAALARNGAQFALSNVSVTGLDLNAMNTLNVRHVGLSAASLDPSGPTTSLIGFAQMARLSRINVIVTGLSNSTLVNKLGVVARFASGPAFAAPRRVKRDAARTSQIPFEAAA